MMWVKREGDRGKDGDRDCWTGRGGERDDEVGGGQGGACVTWRDAGAACRIYRFVWMYAHTHWRAPTHKSTQAHKRARARKHTHTHT